MTNFREKAAELDNKFPSLKDEFFHPTLKSLGVGSEDKVGTYLCGNSLGLMPKNAYKALTDEMDAWKGLGVNGHATRPDGSGGWVAKDDEVIPGLAKICGSKESEVAYTGGLTINLNSLLSTFYKPQGKRTKILFEAKAFPSDSYCLQNQCKMHGLDYNEHLIRAFPREGEYTLHTEDILDIIEKQGDEIAVVIFSGIQYYTGQLFDMPTITKKAQEKGCIVGWDLAHAVGNAELQLHDWNVDFAVFCTYKYLNSGPGSIGGLFVHERHFETDLPHPSGWFGVPVETRFDMDYDYVPIKGARAWVQTCTNWSGIPATRESLKLFEKAGWVQGLRPRALSLTNFLEEMLKASPHYGNKERGMTIITPSDPKQRGTQLSVLFSGEGTMMHVFENLEKRGIIGDKRKPDVMRIAPTALYNTHEDVVNCVESINEFIDQLKK